MEIAFMDTLIQYGALGTFVGYLIYDRQVIMSKVLKSMDANTNVLHELALRIRNAPCGKVTKGGN